MEDGELSDGESRKDIGATSGLALLLADDGDLNAGDLRVDLGAAFELEPLLDAGDVLGDFRADIGAA